MFGIRKAVKRKVRKTAVKAAGKAQKLHDGNKGRKRTAKRKAR